MKFFLDTANIDEIKDAVEYGLIDGVTTNPSLVSKEGKGFKEILRDKFPDEELTIQEMFPGIDGKFRYLKKNRIDVYSKMLNYIRNFSHKPYVYMCMETSDFWKTVFNKDFANPAALEKDFCGYLKDNFKII